PRQIDAERDRGEDRADQIRGEQIAAAADEVEVARVLAVLGDARLRQDRLLQRADEPEHVDAERDGGEQEADEQLAEHLSAGAAEIGAYRCALLYGDSRCNGHWEPPPSCMP